MKNNCIEFQGCKTKGYGRKQHDGKLWRAHRLAWTKTKGEIPDGLCVLHKCDNRACVNVDHLFLGTNADNMADRDAKGRGAHGEKHGRAKLTEAQILDIRERYAAGGIYQRELAAEFGVTQALIHKIVNRKIWKQVDE